MPLENEGKGRNFVSTQTATMGWHLQYIAVGPSFYNSQLWRMTYYSSLDLTDFKKERWSKGTGPELYTQHQHLLLPQAKH